MSLTESETLIKFQESLECSSSCANISSDRERLCSRLVPRKKRTPRNSFDIAPANSIIKNNWSCDTCNRPIRKYIGSPEEKSFELPTDPDIIIFRNNRAINEGTLYVNGRKTILNLKKCSRRG